AWDRAPLEHFDRALELRHAPRVGRPALHDGACEAIKAAVQRLEAVVQRLEVAVHAIVLCGDDAYEPRQHVDRLVQASVRLVQSGIRLVQPGVRTPLGLLDRSHALLETTEPFVAEPDELSV